MKYLTLLLLTLLLSSCDKKKKIDSEIDKNTLENQNKYQEIGLEYATATQALLGKNLLEKIKEEGTIEALAFCNIEAMPLTKTMATKYKAEIKRVSDKNRNSDNKANAEELNYITKFKKDAVTSIISKPVVLEKGDNIHFYYPILMNTMCLQCHGKPEDIKPEVLLKIKNLYPDDLATGYSENEVRGIWSIVYAKK